MRRKIIAEANFIQATVYELFKQNQPINVREFESISERLQTIRDEARKDREDIEDQYTLSREAQGDS